MKIIARLGPNSARLAYWKTIALIQVSNSSPADRSDNPPSGIVDYTGRCRFCGGRAACQPTLE
jgi:hypothetical protein